MTKNDKKSVEDKIFPFGLVARESQFESTCSVWNGRGRDFKEDLRKYLEFFVRRRRPAFSF